MNVRKNARFYAARSTLAGAAAPRRWPSTARPRNAASICREPDHVRVGTGRTSTATGKQASSATATDLMINRIIN
jgi:hypothetical protein